MENTTHYRQPCTTKTALILLATCHLSESLEVIARKHSHQALLTLATWMTANIGQYHTMTVAPLLQTLMDKQARSDFALSRVTARRLNQLRSFQCFG